MMYGYGDGWGWGAWVAMGFMMLVFWGVIAAVVVYAVRSSGNRSEQHPLPSPPAPGDQAQRILDERFARGEIDAEEYSQRRDLLRSR